MTDLKDDVAWWLHHLNALELKTGWRLGLERLLQRMLYQLERNPDPCTCEVDRFDFNCPVHGTDW